VLNIATNILITKETVYFKIKYYVVLM